jgi:ribosomal protein S18 acetylase RimI-like enzyme
MSDLTIRAATPADMPRLIDIMCDDPPGDMRAIEPDLRKAKAIGALAMRAGMEIAVERTVVALDDGRAVGLLETKRPGDKKQAVSALAIPTVLIRGLQIVGFPGLVRYLRYQRARAKVQIEHPPDAYYIGELDVDPTCRNRGIGAQLLAYAEAEARALGIARMALCAGISNPAQHLYERAGYRIAETRRHTDYERITNNPGRVLMVKDLG